MKYLIIMTAALIMLALPACSIAADPDNYGWQTGVYAERANAVSEKNKLRQKRLVVNIYEKRIDGRKMFAVVVGSYSTREEALKSKPLVELICDCELMLYEK
ncbi:MAG: SPOR domain-containing protein [Candidatus Kapaibacterium sp.]